MVIDRCYHTIALNECRKRHQPRRLTVGPSALKLKCTLHRMNMGDGMMHTTNQKIIFRRIQERKSFMMNQATPHLGAESSLINNKSSNRRRQPRMCTALTTEWM